MEEQNRERELIGINLRTARIEAGYTQTAAANKIGMTQPHLSMIEKGKRRISAEDAQSLFRLYCNEEDNPDEPPAENESFAVQAVKLLEELAEKGGTRLSEAADSYICLCAYVFLRKLYLTNPHNTERIFTIPQSSMQDLERLISDEPDKASDFARESKDVSCRKIEPSELTAKKIVRIVRRCEKIISSATNTGEYDENDHN